MPPSFNRPALSFSLALQIKPCPQGLSRGGLTAEITAEITAAVMIAGTPEPFIRIESEFFQKLSQKPDEPKEKPEENYDEDNNSDWKAVYLQIRHINDHAV